MTSSNPGIRRRAQLLTLIGMASAHWLVSSASWSDETIDPNQDGSQYGWAENVGWFNAEPMGDGGPGVAVYLDRAEGWIWSENVGWISLSCHNTNSCGAVPYGVSNDGVGNLSGFAWSENAGWISLSCLNTSSCGAVNYSVSFDTGSGAFSGWGWSESLGWLSFACENTASCAQVDYRVVTDLDLIEGSVFADGFESGDASSWTAVVP